MLYRRYDGHHGLLTAASPDQADEARGGRPHAAVEQARRRMSDTPAPNLPGRSAEPAMRPGAVGGDAQRMWRLERAESPRLLGSVTLGRVVFTEKTMPAIRPVNHLIDVDGAVIIRSHLRAAVLSRLGEVVAYEADQIDLHSHTGVGRGRDRHRPPVHDPDRVVGSEQLL